MALEEYQERRIGVFLLEIRRICCVAKICSKFMVIDRNSHVAREWYNKEP